MKRFKMFRKMPGLVVIALAGFFSNTFGVTKDQTVARPGTLTASVIPNQQQCTHKVGRLWFTVSNYGLLGNQNNHSVLRDCITGGPSSSAEFPGGSLIEYLFQGTLWVGGIVNGDTLVSTGHDGWLGTEELKPDQGANGEIIRRSSNPSSPYFSPNAISAMDFIATMFDTLVDCSFMACVDPYNGKPHTPLGLKIVQTSLSYTGPLTQDLIIIHYKLENIFPDTIKDGYVGFFWDGDVGHPSTGSYYVDDHAGLFSTDVTVTGQPVHFEIPYLVDNDGDPSGTQFGPNSSRAVAGLMFLKASQPVGITSFNWWTPNGNVNLDWGPQQTPGRINFSGGRGQPEGDAMKYYYLSNGEKDYDQVKSALNFTTEGWLPPLASQANAIDIANGYDARYLYSFGPFQLAPAETLSFSMALLMGENFHKAARNFAQNLGFTAANYLDTARIGAYQRGLDFSDLISKALAAMVQIGLINSPRGDINGDGLLSLSDIVALLNIVFTGVPPAVLSLHDLNCDGRATPVDIVLLLNFLYLNQPLPC